LTAVSEPRHCTHALAFGLPSLLISFDSALLPVVS
jgi:hypothetical protein